MPRSQNIPDSLAEVLDESTQPTYVVDAERRVIYGNHALAHWIDLPLKRIIGRRVEFHSEEPASEQAVRSDTAPLTDLCPPPLALAGQRSAGTISCLARDGHMLHRAAQFIPLGQKRTRKSNQPQTSAPNAVLVLLAAQDLSPQEIAAAVSGGATTDELHRTIRRFRRGQANRYSIKSLLGVSAAMQKVRAQIDAAAASGADVLISGPPGSGRTHIALAIHYRDSTERKTPDTARLARIDCRLLNDSVLTQTMERLKASPPDDTRPTLLLEHLEHLSAPYAAELLGLIVSRQLNARILATFESLYVPADSAETSAAADNRPDIETPASSPLPRLVDIISTITVHVPPLVDRLQDLPLLSQFFLEACNRGSTRQIGSLRPEALDALALYSWPGELVQLQQTIEAAHAACTSHEIAAADLPPLIGHALGAATRVRRQPQRIVLDELLADVEKQVITRALAQTAGNKSEAATLLGITRPRLYRRLVQLGFISEIGLDDETAESPEFIEQESAE
jgi:transcriptional regulator with PAS, ATPase and Fis domain